MRKIKIWDAKRKVEEMKGLVLVMSLSNQAEFSEPFRCGDNLLTPFPSRMLLQYTIEGSRKKVK